MKAIELVSYFQKLLPDYDFSDTVDKVVFGDEASEVRRVLVTWMVNEAVIDYARTKNFDTIITHEPTVWIHQNEHDVSQLPAVQQDYAKKRIRRLAEAGITVIRIHDCWDHFPVYGIPWSWAGFLGLGNQPVATRFNDCQQRYDFSPVTLKSLAESISGKTKALGEDLVTVYGDPDQIVSSIGIGTGCYCSIHKYLEMGCDVSLICDDASSYWQAISWALDIGHAVIVVSHGTSEQPGMMNLAKYMTENLPALQTEFYQFDLKKHYY